MLFIPGQAEFKVSPTPSQATYSQVEMGGVDEKLFLEVKASSRLVLWISSFKENVFSVIMFNVCKRNAYSVYKDVEMSRKGCVPLDKEVS